jgi:hypothetical protein
MTAQPCCTHRTKPTLNTQHPTYQDGCYRNSYPPRKVPGGEKKRKAKKIKIKKTESLFLKKSINPNQKPKAKNDWVNSVQPR